MPSRSPDIPPDASFPERPLEEVPEEIAERVDAIGEAYVERLRLGARPDAQSLVRAHPDLAPWLERRLRLLEWMQELGSGSEGVPDEDTAGRAAVRCPHCRSLVAPPATVPGEARCERCDGRFLVDDVPHGLPTAEADGKATSIGRFRVLETLGQGSFGVVYRALDSSLDRVVTLKRPRSGFFRSDEEERRFRREARSAARLRHPGIVQVHEVLEENGTLCIVREYIEGQTLDRLVRERPPSARRAARLVRQVADAIHWAHGHGVVHRDIKPENILIDRRGAPHVTDFGLACRDEGEVTVTLDGQILGTPAYMAPEQAAGAHDRVTARSDVYALGVVLYELLTGERPFTGHRSMVLYQVLHDEPRPPRRLNDHVPRDLEVICLRAMAKDPARRYASAAELRNDLDRFLDGRPILARPAGRTERAWRWCRRNRAVASLAAAVVLLLVAAAIGSTVAALRFETQRRRAEEIARQTTEALEERRRQLVRVHVTAGIALADAGDPVGSLPHFAEALRQDAGDPVRELPHRIRIASTVARSARLLRLWRGPGAVDRVLFDASGSLAAFVSERRAGAAEAAPVAHVVRVIDLASKGSGDRSLPHPGRVRSAEFHPTAPWLLTAADDGRARVWHGERAEVTTELDHGPGCRHATWMPDGNRVVTVGTDRSVRVWSTEPVRELSRLTLDRMPLDAEVGPNGRWVAARLARSVLLWDLAEEHPSAEIEYPSGTPIRRVRFHPDGTHVATAGASGEARLWNVPGGEPRGRAMPHRLGVVDLDFGPHGHRLITASHDKARVWDARTGLPLTGVLEPQFNQRLARFGPDGRHAATSSGYRTVYVWDVWRGGPALPPLRHTSPVTGLTFHPSGHLLLTADAAGLVHLWDIAGAQPESSVVEHDREVSSVEVSSDGALYVTASRDGTARVAWLGSGVEEARLPHPRRVLRAMWRPRRREIVTTCEDGRTRLFELGRAEPRWNVRVTEGVGSHWAALSPDGDLVAAASNRGAVSLRDAESGEVRGDGWSLGAETRVLVFDPRGERLVAVGLDGTTRCLDVRGGDPIWEVEHGRSAGHCAAFSPDGSLVVTGHADGSALVREASTGKVLSRAGGGPEPPHTARVVHVEFVPAGDRYLTASTDGRARLWSSTTGRGQSPWIRHGSIRDARLSRDGRWVATASRSKTGRVWDLLTGEPVLPLLQHSADVESVAFDPSGRHVLTAGFDGRVKVWDMRADSRPVEDLLLLAEVLSGLRIGPAGVEPLSAAEIERSWRRLRTRRPEDHDISRADRRRWHLRQVQEADRRGDRHGVMWHADRWLEETAERRDEAEERIVVERRGRAFAGSRRWEEAAADFRRAALLDPLDPEPAYRWALLSRVAGQGAEHRRACDHLVLAARQSSDASLLLRTVRASNLAAVPPKRAEEILELARRAVRLAPSTTSHGALGAALYRAGQLDAADVQLGMARLYFPRGRPDLFGGTFHELLFLAMVHAARGMTREARSYLDAAEERIEEALRSGRTRSGSTLNWRRRLRMQLLRDEARSVVGRGEDGTT